MTKTYLLEEAKELVKNIIKKGNRYLCTADYVMLVGNTAYTKGKTYLSENDKCITDNEFDVLHDMCEEVDFKDYFQLLTKQPKNPNLSDLIQSTQEAADKIAKGYVVKIEKL